MPPQIKINDYDIRSHVDFERRPGDVFVSPANDHDVFSSFSYHVIHLIIIAAHVFDEDFFARAFRTVYTDKQDVISWNENFSLKTKELSGEENYVFWLKVKNYIK